jgi:sarcosine oxidase
MSRIYDAIVVGLGAMGSAAAFHLAQRGQSVLGLDQFTPPHTLGSSHGQTRIIREAYFEHPCYVPLLQRSYELWAELASRCGRPIFHQTGGLMIGPGDGLVVSGALRSAREHNLPHELLTARDVRQRFPALQPSDDMMAVFEPRAGIVFPETAVAAHLELAHQHGADVRLEEAVLRWEPATEGVRVVTARETYSGRQLILTAGAWVSRLLPDLRLPFQVERQILYWFASQSATAATQFQPDRCPIHLWQFDGRQLFYGFPDLGEGVKVARHHAGQPADPDHVDRDVSPAEIEDMRAIVRRFLPGADGPLRQATVCLYTNTPDEHFWLDRHPQHPEVWVISPCSGHGFKFSSVIGEVVADLVERGQTRFDLRLFQARQGEP